MLVPLPQSAALRETAAASSLREGACSGLCASSPRLSRVILSGSAQRRSRKIFKRTLRRGRDPSTRPSGSLRMTGWGSRSVSLHPSPSLFTLHCSLFSRRSFLFIVRCSLFLQRAATACNGLSGRCTRCTCCTCCRSPVLCALNSESWPPTAEQIRENRKLIIAI